MKNVQKAKLILKILNKIYPKTPVPLNTINQSTLLNLVEKKLRD